MHAPPTKKTTSFFSRTGHYGNWDKRKSRDFQHKKFTHRTGVLKRRVAKINIHRRLNLFLNSVGIHRRRFSQRGCNFLSKLSCKRKFSWRVIIEVHLLRFSGSIFLLKTLSRRRCETSYMTDRLHYPTGP